MRRDLFTKVALVLLVILLFANLVATLQTPSHAASAVQYKVVHTHSSAATQQQLQTILDAEGASGWRFIGHYGTREGDVLSSWTEISPQNSSIFDIITVIVRKSSNPLQATLHRSSCKETRRR
jgi:hypothetical protein